MIEVQARMVITVGGTVCSTKGNQEGIFLSSAPQEAGSVVEGISPVSIVFSVLERGVTAFPGRPTFLKDTNSWMASNIQGKARQQKIIRAITTV